MKKLLLISVIFLFAACKKEEIIQIDPFIGHTLIGKTVEQSITEIGKYGITNTELIEFSNGTYRKFWNDTIHILINEADTVMYCHVNYKGNYKIELPQILDYVNSHPDFVFMSTNRYIYKENYYFWITESIWNIYITTTKIVDSNKWVLYDTCIYSGISGNVSMSITNPNSKLHVY